MKKSLITLKLICLKKLTKTKKSLKTLFGRFKDFHSIVLWQIF
ncbi:hypothetical protein N202_02740 [Helicobacter pylori UM067]|nr:hypothetical protein N202_02740 [Helicobacter pylori UM067]